MDLLNMTNRAQFREFYKKVKLRKFLFFKLSYLEFSNFVANWWYEIYGQIQNFSAISLKLCLMGQKNSSETWIMIIMLTFNGSIHRQLKIVL